MPSSLVGINTGVPNKLVKAAIMKSKVKKLGGFNKIRSEVKYGKNSRIDLLLEKGNKKCFIEVKNCTLVEKDIAYFPDAVTSRGLKHLKELDSLQRLNLEGTGVTDVGLVNLQELPSLRWIKLNRTQVTEEGVKKLQQALPNCKIEH